MFNGFSIDVEDWFHILESSASPPRKSWDTLEHRVEPNVKRLLKMLNETNVRATFFWLGWLAQKHKSLVRECCDEGHEIASHSYHHVLPHKVGPEHFKNDIDRSKKVLEDIIGKQVFGFRVPGFGIRKNTKWVFDVIKEVGYYYDSSVFPASINNLSNGLTFGSTRCSRVSHKLIHGKAGLSRVWNQSSISINSQDILTAMGPQIIHTKAGPLIEITVSAAKIFGLRFFFFGGGYLRLAPRQLIQWGIKRIQNAKYPVIVYIHPREVDQNTPRLPLNMYRYFRSYININSTMPKLRWLCENYKFIPLHDLAVIFSGC